MKFNLKTRPKIGWDRNPSPLIKAYEEWFEGFEKELREKQKGYYQSSKWISIKEILGE